MTRILMIQILGSAAFTVCLGIPGSSFFTGKTVNMVANGAPRIISRRDWPRAFWNSNGLFLVLALMNVFGVYFLVVGPVPVPVPD